MQHVKPSFRKELNNVIHGSAFYVVMQETTNSTIDDIGVRYVQMTVIA